MKSTFRLIYPYCVLLVYSVGEMSCVKTNPADSKITAKNITLLKEITLPFDEPSAITFSEQLQKLWVVCGGNQHVYELDTSGNVINKLLFKGIDLEGITYDDSDTTLWVIDESTKVISHIDLVGNTIFQKQLSYTITNPNNGPEGITIGKNHTFFIINESHPSIAMKLNSNFDISATVQLTFAPDYSDISYHKISGTFFIISDEGMAFFQTDENMNAIEKYLLPGDKYEGIAYNDGKKLFYIVNDARNTLSWLKIN